jgi:hypothetical protein
MRSATTTSAAVAVTVSNVPPPPDITPHCGADGAQRYGERHGRGHAADNVGGRSGVRRRGVAQDGHKRPYSVAGTTTVTDGAVTLTAVARDAAGNTTTSAPVDVIVSNAVVRRWRSFRPTLHAALFRLPQRRRRVAGVMNLTGTAATFTAPSTSQHQRTDVCCAARRPGIVARSTSRYADLVSRMPFEDLPRQATIDQVRAWILLAHPALTLSPTLRPPAVSSPPPLPIQRADISR